MVAVRNNADLQCTRMIVWFLGVAKQHSKTIHVPGSTMICAAKHLIAATNEWLKPLSVSMNVGDPGP